MLQVGEADRSLPSPSRRARLAGAARRPSPATTRNRSNAMSDPSTQPLGETHVRMTGDTGAPLHYSALDGRSREQALIDAGLFAARQGHARPTFVSAGSVFDPTAEDREQGAPVDWQAITKQRDRELKAAEEARHEAQQERDKARQWARHGYEIGQKHCGWSDHGVAPAWLTEGWPPHIDSCEHLKHATDLEEADAIRKRVAKECRASLADALGVDRLRDWDDIRNTAAGLRKERDAQAEVLERVRQESARIRATTRTWEPVADRIDAALAGAGNPESKPRLLDCGLCYEEQGEEVHPHPECSVGSRMTPVSPSVEIINAASERLDQLPDQPTVFAGGRDSRLLINGNFYAVSTEHPVVLDPFGSGIPGGRLTLTLNCDRITVDGKEVGEWPTI